MKVYISGPISGTSDYIERFNEAQKYLESKRYTVINPALVNSNLPKDTTWEEYMRVSLVLLEQCDAIYLLKGWERSRGASVEKRHAERLRLPIMKEI